MPFFPDGSRVSVEVDGKALPEYQPVVEKDDNLKTHTISVYIPSEKSKEFKVAYLLTHSRTSTIRTAEVKMDGLVACRYELSREHLDWVSHCKGWMINPKTIRNYMFGEIDTSQDCIAGSSSDMKKEMMRACISFAFSDAFRCAPAFTNLKFAPQKVQLATAVHPDSKLASMVGAQVKAGKETNLRVAETVSSFVNLRKAGSIEYVAKFIYRPAKLLIALDIMPDPDPKAPKDAGEANKRKRGSPADANGAATGGSESAQQRKKRLIAELQAVKQELGEDLGPDPKEVVDLDAPPKPKVFVNLETGGETVKQERTDGIEDEARPKNQKIYLELSDDDNSDDD